MARRSVVVPVADLRDAPRGRRLRQVQFGWSVEAGAERDGWCDATSERDGYSGWIAAAALGEVRDAGHRVDRRAVHVFSAPDLKSPEVMSLGFGAEVEVLRAEHGWCDIGPGWVWGAALSPCTAWHEDPVAVAELFLGTPYLWGGNSVLGVDCSGLVQQAFAACGVMGPGDSAPMRAGFGTPVKSPERGDLIFWKGHVALVSGPGEILHANGHHMAVVHEGLAAATARIASQGDGPVLAVRRVAVPSSGVVG